MATLRCLFLVARALLTSQSHLNRKFSQAWAESVLTFRISDRASLSTSWVRSLLKTSIQSQSRHRSVNVDRFWWLWLMSIELKLIEIRSGWCLGRRLEDRRSSHRTCQAIDPKSSEYTVSNYSPPNFGPVGESSIIYIQPALPYELAAFDWWRHFTHLSTSPHTIFAF